MVDRRRRKNCWYERILELAELKGDYDQVRIAQTVGVTKGTVTNWKKGKPPTPENVIAVARAYGVDEMEMLRIAYLPDYEEQPEAKKAIRPRHPL